MDTEEQTAAPERIPDPQERRRRLRRVLGALRESTRAGAVVYVGLARSEGDRICVAERVTEGDLPDRMQQWVDSRPCLGSLGWSAADLLPLDGPRLHTLPLAGEQVPVAGGLVTSGPRVFGWLGMTPGRTGLPGRRRLLAAWRDAATAITAQTPPLPPTGLPSTALVLDPWGQELFASRLDERWRAVPGLDHTLREFGRSFLRSGAQHRRLALPTGEATYERLEGGAGSAALVRLRPWSPLPRPTLALLSGRQLDVGALAAAGATANEIAESLGVSEETVRSHLKAAYRRLAVANRLELAEVFQSPWAVPA